MAADPEKIPAKEAIDIDNGSHDSQDMEAGITGHTLKKDLKNRHMQIIAIGGAIGAGLFVGSGGALSKGGPASLIIGYSVVGIMLLFTCQAMAELAVLYPVNGAFYTYVVRFVDPSWGFAVGWDYALSWLTVLPFELIAASITIEYWREDISMGVWVTVFLVILCVIQVFGVRGYGEVEFVLSMIKIAACLGFIILGIVINTGGVGDRGYIGARFWHEPGAFRNGFNGFASVFVIAAFSFGGTELVFWRIAFFYIVNLLIVGLILPSDDDRLLNSSGANTKASPFVLAIQDAGIAVLPSIMNAVVTVAVISVANSCTFGSTRTMQALAEQGMAPKFLAYIDKHGRPLWCVVIQLAFGLLSYLGLASEGTTVFNWLLAISGLSYFFVWGSLCLTHIRFRYIWKAQGYTLDQIPYRPGLGVWGSWIGLGLNVLCLIATFYSSLYPSPNAVPNAEDFFMSYLAAPIILALYLGWKTYTRDWRLWIPAEEVDLLSGLRMHIPGDDEKPVERTWKNLPMRIVKGLFQIRHAPGQPCTDRGGMNGFKVRDRAR
ncbi:amino-acid permease inda1 [Parathielavia hyrcaniae]|uniref:Amino-acid permease inda1 n=1 Tax=Parathielavia hyrcaniae TaxID=113614 RepID=A0AAN6QA59_9PEZI|nr:amino-acid permease inda1 [Parathielavia hyrcaniae]